MHLYRVIFWKSIYVMGNILLGTVRRLTRQWQALKGSGGTSFNHISYIVPRVWAKHPPFWGNSLKAQLNSCDKLLFKRT